MDVNIRERYGWSCSTHGQTVIYSAGYIPTLDEFKHGALEPNKLIEKIGNIDSSFSIVIDSEDFCFAAVDRLSSYPLFYTSFPDGQNSISSLAEDLLGGDTVDLLGVTEFLMAGYALNHRTLKKNIKRLLPGELLIYDKVNNLLNLKRYYKYSPQNTVNRIAECDYIEELDTIIDKSISSTITMANGSPIYLPLSGGYDSRLILAKLLQNKYDNLRVFSYGGKGNFESNMARHIAKKLNVKWEFINLRKVIESYTLSSPLMKDYIFYASNLSVVPTILDFAAFLSLAQSSDFDNDALVVNGQSGDFITGGHIPKPLFDERSKLSLCRHLQHKHFGLWKNLEDSEEQNLIINSIVEKDGFNDLISLYESWEWQERQAKFVVNGQRVYDFFGLKWHLPLWDNALMDFWEKIPYDLKLQQKLYIAYLKKYNFKGCFDEPRATPHLWRGKLFWVRPYAKIKELIAGIDSKNDFYRKMSYYSIDHYQYKLFGFSEYNRYSRIARNAVSLLAKLIVEHYNNDDSCLDVSHLLKKISVQGKR